VVAGDLFLATYDPAARPYGHLRRLDDGRAVYDVVKQRQGLDRPFVDHPWPFTPQTMSKQGTLREIYMINDYEVLSPERFGRYCNARNAAPGVAEVTQFSGICFFNPTPGRVRL